ncbi:MAG: glycoside hydrolase family 38 C-terminal domain-containing protein [bacterium]
MKKSFVFIALLIFTLTLTEYQVQASNTKLDKAVREMLDLVFQPVKWWQMSESMSMEEVMNPDTSEKKFRRVKVGYVWPSAQKPSIWLRTRIKIPETILTLSTAGSRVALKMAIDDYGEVYVNGEFKQKFRRSGGYVVLTESATPGEEIFVVVKATGTGGSGLLRHSSLAFSLLKEVEDRIYGLSEAIAPLDFLLQLGGEDPAKWKDLLDEAGDALDLQALENGRLKDFLVSLDRCVQILSPVTSIMRKYSMMLVGYSHIDPAWLWDKAEGEHIVWKGTSENILKLIDEFPEFVYAANQMHCYRWMENDYPELFARIKEAIAKGRWEPVGAEWVEPDGNLPSGESFVRQFMYGRKYSLEKFGIVSTVGWTPDSFGYNWNLPQILAKSDMRGFVSVKLHANDTTQFPYNIFWWEAPDGSRVLVNFPPGHYTEPVYGGVLASQLIEVKQKHNADGVLAIFGSGDHGGGIPRDYVERAFQLKDAPIYPKIEFMTVEEMFDRLIEQDKTLNYPTWNDEMYLEKHRGCYTSQAKTKNNNRRNEHRLMNAERFSSIAAIATGLKYAFEKIEEAWKILLFNQFHDILPGSSITPVFKDADADHAWIAQQSEEAVSGAIEAIAAQADTTGEGTPVVLFNGLSWTRDDVIEVELNAGVNVASVFDDSGREVTSQIIAGSGGKKAVLFVARSLPAMGFAVYRVVEGRKPAAAGGAVSASENTLENEYFRVKVDPANGWITSIYDKKNSREIVEAGKAAFQLQALKELSSSSAWDAVYPPDGGVMAMPDAEEVSVVENGPVRVAIMTRRKFGEKSEFRQYYSIVEGVPVVFARLDTDWHETHVTLKSTFSFNLDADYATCEIPYATIKRVSKPKTPAEQAKWEVSCHRWIDYTNNKKDYGAALLSFSKYGYDVRNNVLRITLLRAPTSPDPEADRGSHSIPYALYPHSGDWTAADSPSRGAEYNDPVIILKTASHNGKLGKRFSFFATGNNVAITTIKRAENGEGFILRLVETEGMDSTAAVALPATPKKIIETNLVERDLKELPTPDGKMLTIPIGHYEIKSLRVVF